jgi:hypothetical protein
MQRRAAQWTAALAAFGDARHGDFDMSGAAEMEPAWAQTPNQ